MKCAIHLFYFLNGVVKLNVLKTAASGCPPFFSSVCKYLRLSWTSHWHRMKELKLFHILKL